MSREGLLPVDVSAVRGSGSAARSSAGSGQGPRPGSVCVKTQVIAFSYTIPIDSPLSQTDDSEPYFGVHKRMGA